MAIITRTSVVDNPTAKTTSKNNPATLVSALCRIIQTKPGCQYFLDNPDVIEAIKRNDPKTLTEMTHSFIQNALGQIELLIEEHTRSTIPEFFSSWTRKQMRNNFGHLTVCADCSDYSFDEKVGLQEQLLITFQLMLWSCMSKEIFNCIVTNLREFHPIRFWSCLHCVTNSVSGTVRCTYNIYATPHEMEHPCEVLLLASSIYHIFAAFGLLVKEFRHIIPSPKLSTINYGSPPKIMDQRFKLATKFYLAYLKGMTKSYSILPRTGKEYSLDFFVEELGTHSNSWNVHSHIIMCISSWRTIKIHDNQIQTKNRFIREYVTDLSRLKRKCR